MNLIVPMAGKGKRLRPHTLTTPKPLIPIAGKPIVQRLVEDIAEVTPEKIEKIGFVVGDFGSKVESDLLDIAEKLGAKGYIFYQEEALGTAHAVHCAKELLEGKVIVAFSDTLFRANFTLNTDDDGIIWVKSVEDPSAFGVVKLDNGGIISEFLEKPKTPVSNLAIIGIYYFNEGKKLLEQLDYIITNKITSGGEYQITVALENLRAGGTRFTAGQVEDWLDCGNMVATVASNSAYLSYLDRSYVADSVQSVNSMIIPPVFIADNVVLKNSVVGPNVSIGMDSLIEDSRLKDCLIQNNVTLTGVNLISSMIGNEVKMEEKAISVSMGDYSESGI